MVEVTWFNSTSNIFNVAEGVCGLKALHGSQATNGCRQLKSDAGEQIRSSFVVKRQLLDPQNSSCTGYVCLSYFFLGVILNFVVSPSEYLLKLVD